MIPYSNLPFIENSYYSYRNIDARQSGARELLEGREHEGTLLVIYIKDSLSIKH